MFFFQKFKIYLDLKGYLLDKEFLPKLNNSRENYTFQ